MEYDCLRDAKLKACSPPSIFDDMSPEYDSFEDWRRLYQLDATGSK